MSAPAPETKDTAKKMTLGGVGKSLLGGAKKTVNKTVDFLHKKFGSTEHIDEGKKLSNTEYLGEIFKMMKVMDEDKKLNHEMANNHLEEEEHKKDQRNKEIISALTGKKFKGTKFKSKLKRKSKKKNKATKISEPESSGGGFSLGTLGLGTIGAAAVGTAVVVGTGALMTTSSSAFGNTTRMEQNAATHEQQLAKAHQAVADTDKSYSYGTIGLSSKRDGGRSSLDSFIEDNPQFNLPDPGVSGKDSKFLEQWKKIPAEKLLAAQEKWYQEHVYNPTTSLLEKSGVDPTISKDERVRAFMADRANQQGIGNPIKAIKNAGASDAQTAEQFIDKMTEYDKKRIKIKFKSHLEQFPDHEEGLYKRINQRKELSLALKPNEEPKKSTNLNTKLNPKQSSSAKSQNLEIKEDAPAVSESLSDKESEVQTQPAEAPPAVSKPELWKPMVPLYEKDNELYTKKDSGVYAQRAEFARLANLPDSAPKVNEESEEDRKFWQQLELQDLIDKSTQKLSLVQEENADLKIKEEVKNAEEAQVMTNIIIQQNTQSDLPPPVEDFDIRYDGPPIGTSVVRHITIEGQPLPSAQGEK